jgi:hypothetical protein
VCSIDLDGEDRVRSSNLNTFAGGRVLHLICHTSDVRLPTLIESIPEFWECFVPARTPPHQARRDQSSTLGTRR